MVGTMNNTYKQRNSNHSFHRKSSSIPLYKGCAFVFTFTILGLAVSVTGPSIIFLEEISYTWEDEVALIFTGRSVGVIGGWLLSIAVLEGNPSYAGGLIGSGLLGLTLIHFFISFSRHLWWLMAAFAMQGLFMVVSAQGCLAYISVKKYRSTRRIQQFLVFCSFIGCALAPIMLIPLTCQTKFASEPEMVILPPNTTTGNHANASSMPAPAQPIVLRPRRAINDEQVLFEPFSRETETLQGILNTAIPATTLEPSTEFSKLDVLKTNIMSITEPESFIETTKLEVVTTPVVPVSKKEPLIGTTKTPEPTNTPVLDNETAVGTNTTDAMHLNQDNKTIDEGNAVVNMKQVDKDIHLTDIDENAPPIKHTEVQLPIPEINEKSKKPSVSDAEYLNQDKDTADGSNAAAIMKQVDDNIHEKEVMKTTKILNTTPESTTEFTKLEVSKATTLSISKPESFIETTKLEVITTPLVPVSTKEPPIATTITPEPTNIPVLGNEAFTTIGPTTTLHTTSKSEFSKNVTMTEHTPSSTTIDAVAEKLSAVDAMHFNQDNETADESTAGVNMKQVDKDPLLTEIDENTPSVKHTEVQLPLPEKSEESKKPSVSDAEHLNQDKNTADGSNTAAIMKQTDEDVHEIEVNIPLTSSVRKPSVESPVTTKNSTNPPPTSFLERSDNVSILMPDAAATNEDAGVPVANETVDDKLAPLKPKPTSETKSVEEQTADIKKMAEDDAAKRRSNDSYNLHSSYNSNWNRFLPIPWYHEHTREQYVRSVQRVYWAVGFLSLISWFILLPITGFFRRVRLIFECFRGRPKEPRVLRQEDADMLLPLHTQSTVTRVDILPRPHSSLVVPESPLQLRSSVQSLTCAEPQEQQHISFQSSLSVPNFGVFRNKQLQRQKSSYSGYTPESSVYHPYAPEPMAWPLINWPADFWLFMSAFLFAGLETTYGAFLHSFTLHTLQWSPMDALWVTAVFWGGNALGRLCCLCLGPLTDVGLNLLQEAVNLSSESVEIQRPMASSQNDRRTRINRIAALVVRTSGSFLCVISAMMLKHFTKTRFIPQNSQSGDSDGLLLESWNLSKDPATWVGSLGIGLGLGITASSGLCVCNNLGQRLYLAGLLGQMILPATAGYITERMLYNNASETLGRTTLILSSLLFFSLGVDLILKILRGFSWWNHSVDRFQCFIAPRNVPRQRRSRQQFESNALDDVFNDAAASPTKHPLLVPQQPEPLDIPLEHVDLEN